MVAELLDLVFPGRCLHCGAVQPAQWCPSCRGTPAPIACSSVPGLAVWAAADYAGAVREALLRYKERGQRRLAPALVPFLLAALQPLAPDPSTRPRAPITIVPIPSARAAARERGGDHMLRLAHSLAGPLARSPGAGGRPSPVPVRVAPVLQLRGRGSDSAGLTAQQRRGRSSSMSALAPQPGTDRRVVIVDDIITTGTTLARAAEALTTAGWLVTGAAVIAATQRRSQPAPGHPDTVGRLA